MRRRRLLSLGLGIGFGLVAVEAALQVGAFVVWSRRQEGDATGRPILCVGDSFTYGLGATGARGSYPRQLEALLRARGEDVAVVNGGWPGQSSREVLLRLPDQLARYRPRLVCILVGVNDPVKRPARVTDGELAADTDSGFPIRLRLLQVFSMMGAWFRSTPEAPAFVGTWHAGDLEVVFERDGRVRMGKDELRWLADDGGVQLVLPSGGVQPLQHRIDGGRLIVTTPSFTHTLEPGPPPSPPALVRAQQALARGDHARAEPLFREALQRTEHAAAAREGLVRLAVAAGDTAAADGWIEELRASHAAGRDTATGEALAQALFVRGSTEAALAVAEQVLRGAPDSLRTWDLLLRGAMVTGERQRVFSCMAALLGAARGDEAWRPALLQMRSSLRRLEDPVGALHDLFLAFLQDGDGAFLARQVELAGGGFSPGVRAGALAQLSPDERERVRSVLAGDAGQSGVLTTLRAHLERMLLLCRANGTEVWLLGYPEADATRDQVVAGVAAAHGVRFLPVHGAFTDLSATVPRNELFIADGHCTDRGYGVLAEVVAGAMR